MRLHSASLSSAECALLTRLFGPRAEVYIDMVGKHGVTAPNVWQLAALRAFQHNMFGPDVDSLRLVSKAIDDQSPYRLTKEFDALCGDQ